MGILNICVVMFLGMMTGTASLSASATTWVDTESRVFSKLVLEAALDGLLDSGLDGKVIPVKSTVKGLKNLKVSFPKGSVVIKIKELFRHRKTAPKEYQAEFFVEGTDVKFSGEYRVHESKEIEIFGVKKKITLVDHTFDLESKMTFQVSGTIGFGTTAIKDGAKFFKAPLFEVKEDKKEYYKRSSQSLGLGVDVSKIHVVALETTKLVQKIQEFSGTDLRQVLNDQFNQAANQNRINVEINKQIDTQYKAGKTKVFGKVAKLALEL